MAKSTLCILLVGMMTVSCLDPISYQDPDLIKWRGLDEPAATKIIKERVSLGMSADSVKIFLKKQKLTFSVLTPQGAGYYQTAATAIMREDVMMKAKWLFKFYFDAHRKLTKLEVKKGLISF